MSTTPFQQGVIAAKSGDNRELNPYPDGTDPHAAWLDGYIAANAACLVQGDLSLD